MISTTAQMHGGGRGGGAGRGGRTGATQAGECGLRKKTIMLGALLTTPQNTAGGQAFGLSEVGWGRISCMNPGTGVVATGGAVMAGVAAMQRADGPDAVDESGSGDFISRPAEKVDTTVTTPRRVAD